MLIKNGILFCDDGTFRILDLETNGGQISALGSVTGNEQQVLDATGCYVVPGLVDIHIHGAMGADFSDGETAWRIDGLEGWRDYKVSWAARDVDNKDLDVHIENSARHPSVLSCAVNVGCWSHRRGTIVIDSDLNYELLTHKGVEL